MAGNRPGARPTQGWLYVRVGESNVLEGGRRDRTGVGPADGLGDGPGAELRRAVERLRRELTAHRPPLPDQAVAEDELEALARQAESAERGDGCPAVPDSDRMRHSLLLVAAVLGSVSALAAPLEDLREAVECLSGQPLGGF